eukprot:1912849-Lingulodinium_polyedra.AAC.1
MQNKLIRSPADCLKFHSDQAAGGALESLSATLALLRDAGTLEAIGFTVSFTGAKAQELHDG